MKAQGPVGIVEVAKRARVGIGSVSRVFSGQPGVSEQMRKRVLKAAESLNYEPNMLAQALRSRTTHTVGFVGADITNPLLASIVNGAEAVLTAAGYTILLTNSGSQPALDAEHIRLLLRRQVDGLILLPSAEDDPDLLATLGRVRVPFVVIDRSMPPELKARYVLSDHYVGIHEAASHLLGLGHERLAIIVGRDNRPSRERIKAVHDAYVSRKQSPTFVIDSGPLSAEHGENALKMLLDSPNPPTAVILGGNQLLEGALAVVRARRLTLGRDLSLVTCDDVPLGRLYETPIATVVRDVDLIGRAAAQLLLGSITNPQRSGQARSLPTWFEARASCGAPIERPKRTKAAGSRRI
jgi:LacI family transcriptional regulator